jgi:hypothetical protein
LVGDAPLFVAKATAKSFTNARILYFGASHLTAVFSLLTLVLIRIVVGLGLKNSNIYFVAPNSLCIALLT